MGDGRLDTQVQFIHACHAISAEEASSASIYLDDDIFIIDPKDIYDWTVDFSYQSCR